MQTNTTGISRRNFIGGMAGAGALAALGLAGCAPKAQGEATGDTKKADGAAEGQNAAADWLGTAPEIAESDIKETKECDLLIVGAGNGGMAAAAYAADKGVDFMICEKGETVGATRHWFAAVDTPPFTSQGVTVDRQRLMGEIVRYSQGNCDQRLIRMWMDESADMFAFVDGIMTAAGARVIADEYEMPGGMGGTPYYKMCIRDSTDTITHYLDLLSQAGLLSGLKKYSDKLLEAKTSSPRLLVHDTSLMVATSGEDRAALMEDPDRRGHLVESAVGAYLLARSRKEHFDLYWWRDGTAEVDFVIKKGKKRTALEVKSGRPKRTKGLGEFVSRFPGTYSLIIGSKDFPIEDFLLGKVPLFQ